MTSRTFVVSTLALAALLAAGVAAINASVDFYGLYGDARGEERIVAAKDRLGKYLFGFNHIPSNYDALLVGSSISANVDTSLVPGVRMYNLSISAANMTDEALLLGNALDHGRYALVVFCLNPYLMADTTQKGGPLSPRDWWSGLGSLPLFQDYAVRAAEELGLYRRRFDAWGGEVFGPADPAMPDGEEALVEVLARTPPAERLRFPIDPEATALLDESLRRTRADGARVVAFFPPVYDGRYAAFRPAYAEFEDRMRALFLPGEQVIGYNDGSLAELTRDPDSFRGSVHYSPAGAAVLSRALASAIAGPAPTGE